MADDERKTLLKIEGDAKEAVKAAEDTRRAVENLDDAAGGAAERMSEGTRKATAAAHDQAEAVREASDGHDGLSESVAGSQGQLHAFRQAISRLSPELGGMIDLVMKGGEAFGFLFTPVGAGATAALLAIGSVTKALAEAEKRLDAFYEKQQRILNMRRTVEETLAQSLAAEGISSDAALGVAHK